MVMVDNIIFFSLGNYYNIIQLLVFLRFSQAGSYLESLRHLHVRLWVSCWLGPEFSKDLNNDSDKKGRGSETSKERFRTYFTQSHNVYMYLSHPVAQSPKMISIVLFSCTVQ